MVISFPFVTYSPKNMLQSPRSSAGSFNSPVASPDRGPLRGMSEFHVATSRRKWTKCVDSCALTHVAIRKDRHPLGNGKLKTRVDLLHLVKIKQFH